MNRVTVLKTYKLYINGKFTRTESGRTVPIENTSGEQIAHLCRGSRKDLRNAIEAASKAQSGWGDRTAYNRGQILYRMAEMLEARREEFVQLDAEEDTSERVDAAIDRLVCFAGWADKFAQVLGCNNPVAGPYYNFTVPEPTGLVGMVAPDQPALLGLVSLLAPPLCAGNTVVVIASEKRPISAAVFAEVCETSDVPPGVVNILTGYREELLEHLAKHREVSAISAANLPSEQAMTLQLGAAENLKRVKVIERAQDEWSDPDRCESPWTIEPFVESKTIWHPSAT